MRRADPELRRDGHRGARQQFAHQVRAGGAHQARRGRRHEDSLLLRDGPAQVRLPAGEPDGAVERRAEDFAPGGGAEPGPREATLPGKVGRGGRERGKRVGGDGPEVDGVIMSFLGKL